MNRMVLAMTLCAIPAPLSAQDKASERLSKLLAPRGLENRQPDVAPGPSRFTPRSMPLPDAPLPKVDAPPPELPRPTAKPVQPRPASEDAPLVRSLGRSEPPPPLALPVQPMVRLWSPDSAAPLPLPIVGTAVRDRAPLDDPTLTASVAAVQAKVSVGRGQPVPFEPHNLPNPFEHAEAVRLRQPVAESPMPPLTLKPLGP
jgi:hypothetical protein